ncbi:hypothetical protein HJG60_008087 [Phyllostomus discolor]|uniref:Uncharacterized protein n=1 Tax=Phyllostomus discolor TaxID=89673 RepID=A0A834BI38_9CHIR|nr:hypothetical protein HJG60_008087 [Phyllostomus discolor]
MDSSDLQCAGRRSNAGLVGSGPGTVCPSELLTHSRTRCQLTPVQAVPPSVPSFVPSPPLLFYLRLSSFLSTYQALVRHPGWRIWIYTRPLPCRGWGLPGGTAGSVDSGTEHLHSLGEGVPGSGGGGG